MWDNRRTMHRAMTYNPCFVRPMQRARIHRNRPAYLARVNHGPSFPSVTINKDRMKKILEDRAQFFVVNGTTLVNGY